MTTEFNLVAYLKNSLTEQVYRESPWLTGLPYQQFEQPGNLKALETLTSLAFDEANKIREELARLRKIS